MTINELLNEYIEQENILENWAHRVGQMILTSTGETRYKLRNKLQVIEQMAFDCHCVIEWLRSYEMGDDVNENGLYRKRFVGGYHALPYTIECFSLRSGFADGLED